MRVLLTGAGGNLGSETLPRLLEAGHTVRSFELDARIPREVLAPYASRVERVWGDLSREPDVRSAVQGMDAIVHDGFVTPPLSERASEYAERVNVGGMLSLIAGARSAGARIVFASSISAYGITQPRGPHDMLATDHYYGTHKLACEKLLRESDVPHCILRIGVAPPRRPRGGDPEMLRVMFARALDSRTEFVDPRDVALAQTRALTCDAALGKVLPIGGGPRCQLTHRAIVNGVFARLGIGALPERAFGHEPMPGDWLDTRESQALLAYQEHDFDDYLNDLTQHLGFKRFGVTLARPIIRRFLLRYSHARA